MELERIYEPILKELKQVETILKTIGNEMEDPSVQEIFNYFFRNTGKLLRPALAFLSAGTVDHRKMEVINDKLVQLGAAIELIHSASLIHDDIIDGDEMRRGQKTLNKAFDNDLAVWAGDALYSRAFSILSTLFPRDFSQVMLQVTRGMSVVEIQQAAKEDTMPKRDEYLRLIKGKTALLMGASCRLGALLAEADENESHHLENFGVNFGMTYQVIDDYFDRDPLAEGNVKLGEAEQYAANAKHALDGFQESVYKRNLTSMVDYILSHSNQ